LPLQGRSSLIGVMTLGPKLSEEPYSRSDRQLLSSVALQAGLAIENNALVHKLAEESAGRQRIDREIEIAREVQERLLPQIYPIVAGVESPASAALRKRSAAITTTSSPSRMAAWVSPSATSLAKAFCGLVDGVDPCRLAWSHLCRNPRSGPADAGTQPHHLRSSTSNRFVTFSLANTILRRAHLVMSMPATTHP